MPKHILSAGIELIETVYEMGLALGYHAKKEEPVEGRANSPAVDVAWFANDSSRFPLFIFEIESSATNSMANNPTKIYGQSNEQFERPLFFFHVVVHSGIETSRIENLRGIFGTHNYRVYELEKGMGPKLVIDILSQHRRISDKIDVGVLALVLFNSRHLNTNISGVFDHAADQGFSGYYLADFADLADSYEDGLSLFKHQLYERLRRKRWPNTDRGYRTYLGDSWGIPVELGLLGFLFPKEGSYAFQAIVEWQERDGLMSAIGPYFGLSRDYDEFILGWSGSLLALVASLMEKRDWMRYIVEQQLIILRKLERADPRCWFHCAAWTLQVAATASDEVRFCEVQDFVNSRRGIPRGILYGPPAVAGPEDDDAWMKACSKPRRPVPNMHEFLRIREKYSSQVGTFGAVFLALRVLSADEFPEVSGKDLISVLARRLPTIPNP